MSSPIYLKEPGFFWLLTYIGNPSLPIAIYKAIKM